MTAAERNGGGHLRFIDGFLERSAGRSFSRWVSVVQSADLFLSLPWRRASLSFNRDVCRRAAGADRYPRLGVFQDAVADLDA